MVRARRPDVQAPVSGPYSLSANRTGGSCIGDSFSGSLEITGAGELATSIDVGGVSYDCDGRIDGCVWSASCTADDGGTAELRITFNATGFTGTLDESRPDPCTSTFSVSGSRS